MVKFTPLSWKNSNLRGVFLCFQINEGVVVNHKTVLKLMHDNDLLCHYYKRKRRKYNSYKGNIGEVTKNKLHRRFITGGPYQKIVADVT